MDGISLTSEKKTLHDCILSIKREAWVHKTSLTPSLSNGVPIPNQEGTRSCICVLGVQILALFIRYPIRFSTALIYILYNISLFSGQIEIMNKHSALITPSAAFRPLDDRPNADLR